LAKDISALPGVGALGNNISNWWNTPTSPVGDLNPATGNIWGSDLNSGLIAM
jgi:hypothetical protein